MTVPAPGRRFVLGAAALFAYGAVVHVVQLAVGGLDPYPSLPP